MRNRIRAGARGVKGFPQMRSERGRQAVRVEP